MADLNVRITAQDKASPTIASVGKSLGKLGKELGSVQSAVTSLATGGLPGLTRSFSTLTSTLSGSLGPWGLLAGAATAAGGAFVSMAVNAANAVEQLENMSAMTGIATEDLEALQRISEDAGLGTNTLTDSIAKLNRELTEAGGGDIGKVFSALKGSIRDANGQMKDGITVVSELIEKLRQIESPTTRAQLASAAFGKGTREWTKLVNDSTKSIRDQIDAIKDQGRVMDETTKKNMKALDTALDEAAADWDRLKIAILGATGAFLNFFRVSQAPPKTMSLRELVAALPGAVPGKSPLEIQAEQEARAQVIATGATGKKLEIILKIGDAQNRMKGVHGEEQIAIAQEIAGYKRQLELLEKQNRELEEFEERLERIDAEGRRREAMAKIPVMRESEFLMEQVPLPSLLPGPEQVRKMEEGITEGLQDLAYKGIQTNRKATDEIWDYYTDAGIKSQNKIEDMQKDAWREQKRQYEEMIDNIREGAGRVFDAMLTKGESVFESLAKFAEGVLNTMLRGVFQNAVQGLMLQTGLGRLFAPGGGGAGGGAAAIAGGIGGSKGFLGGLGKLFGFGGGGAGKAAAASGDWAGETAGAAGGAGGGIFGLTGVASGLATFGIGLGAAFGASFLSGLFNRGEKRRAEERARRAGIIEANQFMGPETITRTSGTDMDVETDLTGRIRGIGRQPVVVVNVENSMIDARHAKEAGEVIGQAVSQQILAGGSYLADNIAWAAGAP